jgi:hypothetical protein
VPDQLRQQQRIDVAAGQHDHDRRLERRRVLHDGRQRRGPGRLDHQLGPLQRQQQRPGQRLLVDGHHVVDQVAHQRERQLAGAAHRDAVGHGRHRLERHRPAGSQ